MNIYVANLNYRVSSEDLEGIFAEYGTVTSAQVITDNLSGRSRGFGFVEMPDEAAAKKAIEELNGSEYDGKEIVVSVARPKTERPNQRRENDNKGYRGNSGNSGYRSNSRY
ncbi:MAG: RNA-binding protein [Dysgonamonadaceae bacterium]|jgi:RNA recognition motif-containing protein|nr:RNA-binding protein [Dysgonamonadaceae bacterium]